MCRRKRRKPKNTVQGGQKQLTPPRQCFFCEITTPRTFNRCTPKAYSQPSQLRQLPPSNPNLFNPHSPRQRAIQNHGSGFSSSTISTIRGLYLVACSQTSPVVEHCNMQKVSQTLAIRTGSGPLFRPQQAIITNQCVST